MTRVTVIGPNLPADNTTFHVHAAGCADIKRNRIYRRVDPPWTIDVATLPELIEATYSDIMAENEGEWAEWPAYLDEFTVFPCVTLPIATGKISTTPAPPINEPKEGTAMTRTATAAKPASGLTPDTTRKLSDHQATILATLVSYDGQAWTLDEVQATTGIYRRRSKDALARLSERGLVKISKDGTYANTPLAHNWVS